MPGVITRGDFMRAIRVNDTITNEHEVLVSGEGARRVAADLNVDLEAVVTIGAEFAGQHLPEDKPVIERREAIGLTATSYTLGVMSALRARRLVDGATG